MIKPKEKPCKGNGIARGYGCGQVTKYRKYGLCKSNCYPNWLLNSEQGKIKLEKARLKVTEPKRNLQKAKAESKNRSGLTTLLESVKLVCHKYIRERDKGKPCISCGTQWHKDFQAGHYYKAELYSSLKFNELNIHGQCVQCNLRKEGNLNDYDLTLPIRIGKDNYENLKLKAEEYKQKDFKWDREKLKELRTYYREKIKGIK